jgi:hypothetical protein
MGGVRAMRKKLPVGIDGFEKIRTLIESFTLGHISVLNLQNWVFLIVSINSDIC